MSKATDNAWVDNAWVNDHARRIVREAKEYYGQAWADMGAEQRRRAVLVGVAELMFAQHQQYGDTLSKLQAVAVLAVERA